MEGQKMKWPYRCKDCGAYLDPEETCDCKKADELQLNRLKETSKDANINNNNISEEDTICQH